MEANEVINRLREVMKTRHITQADAAARLGVSQNQISLYLAGSPRLDTLLKLCAALDIDPGQLFQEEPSNTASETTTAICPHCKKALKIVIR